jgi:AcrR family transcriptional regulator
VSPRQADPRLGANLIEAAARLLAEEGPLALSTRRLAAAVGTSTMAVYTHFGGMDDLVRTMVHEGFGRLNERLETVGETEDPVADVAALGFVYRGNALENKYLYTVMFGGSGLGGFALTDEDRLHGLYTLEILVRAVKRCMKKGRFRTGDAHLVAYQMWIALHGLVTLELGGYLIEPYEAETSFQAQVRGLIVGAGDDIGQATASISRSRERSGSGG